MAPEARSADSREREQLAAAAEWSRVGSLSEPAPASESELSARSRSRRRYWAPELVEATSSRAARSREPPTRLAKPDGSVLAARAPTRLAEPGESPLAARAARASRARGLERPEDFRTSQQQIAWSRPDRRDPARAFRLCSRIPAWRPHRRPAERWSDPQRHRSPDQRPAYARYRIARRSSSSPTLDGPLHRRPIDSMHSMQEWPLWVRLSTETMMARSIERPTAGWKSLLARHWPIRSFQWIDASATRP